MGQLCRPGSDGTAPWGERVVRTGFGREHLTPPAVMIPADPEHRNPRLHQIGQRGERTEAGARHHMPPGEPEVEEIAHEDQTAGVAGGLAQQAEQGALGLGGGHSEVRITEHEGGGRKHEGSLTRPRDGHKRISCGMAFEIVSEFRVRYAETDQMGVVYHANYLVWCEVGRTDFIRAAGRSYADLEREGVLLAVTDAQLRFHASARYDDLVRVHTALAKIGSRGMTFSYRIVRPDDERLLVTASTSLIAMRPDGRLMTLPPVLRDWLTEHADA